jgi:peptidoglycan/xylan/chitin deacetylase (PgdA/CDA1 family)
MWKFIVLTLICVFLTANTQAQDNAVILVYHHVSQDTPKSTSVSPKTFEQHMQYLADNHTVLPLKTVIDALQKKQPLPDKTVVITFDDGYDNLYHNAHPILQKFDFPYTIFINPALIGKLNHQLNWQQIKHMHDQKVSFANHGNAHIHSLEKPATEPEQDWLNRVTKNVKDAEQLLAEQLDYSLKFFAYPYGEFNQSFKQKLTKLGYVGFGQHSGAIASYSDFSALPRFPSAGIYSNLNTLKVKLNSLAMPVADIKPQEFELNSATDNLNFSFRINSDDINPSQVNCFKKGIKLEHQNSDGLISIELNNMTKAGRHRVNCTAPSKQNRGRYYWLSQPFFVPTTNGKWLD